VLQRGGAVQPGGGPIVSFGSPLALDFFPVSAVEKAARLQAWHIDAVETAR